MRRRFFPAALAIAIACCAPAAHGADAWKPSSKVEIVVPAGPGGANDQLGRTMGKVLADLKLVDVPITVVNKPGGGHVYALSYVNQHPGGDTVMVETVDFLTNYITGKSSASWDDITPLAILLSDYISISVNAASPYRTGKDFIEALKRDPSSISIALSSARANPNHIAAALVGLAGGVDVSKLNIVVFHSGTETLTELMGGHVQAVSGPAFLAGRMLANHKIRILGVASPKRLPGALAGVPTWREQGYDAIATNWRGVIGPKGMTDAQKAFWDHAFSKMTASKEWQDALKKTLSESTYMASAEALDYFKSQYAVFKPVLAKIAPPKTKAAEK
jgi:putative tricarboxylic transport membrane protein